MLLSPAKSKVVYEPLGVYLIMGSWNFPFLTTINPLIFAIIAGNCALVKPSEMSPHCAVIIDKLIKTYLDSSCYISI